jgi:ADP-heptose:LPS heptosyltransferase
MKVAWLCLQGLGDSLMATPAISRMKELRPGWEIHAVTSQENCHQLFKGHPAISRSHLYRHWTLGGAALLRDLAPLILERFDVSLLAYPAVRREYSLLAFAIGAKKKVSLRESAATHNVVNNMQLLGVLDLPADAPPDTYSVPEYWRDRQASRRHVGIHVGSMTYKGNELKRWPLEKYVALCRRLRERGVKLVFIAGPHELPETEYVRNEVEPSAGLINGAIGDVARSLSSLATVISGDNGIAHLAAAVGTPVVVLFGPTDPLRCAPWGHAVTVLRPSDCPPCFDFRDDRFVCKRNIGAVCIRHDLSVDDVERAAYSIAGASNG